ncbi:MAG: hypothetical protein AAGF12_37840 [Myxococcota bacterium]
MIKQTDSLQSYVKQVTAAIGFDVPLETSSDRFVWKGAASHTPPQRRSPLSDRFKRKTVAPSLVLSAACIFIAARRLMARCEVKPTVQIAEALFGFGVNPAFFNMDFEPVSLPRDTPELDASRQLRVRVIRIIKTNADHGKMGSIPLLNVLPILAYTRQIIGKSAHVEFDAWLANAIDELDELDEDVKTGRRFGEFEDRAAWRAYVEQRFGEACPFEWLRTTEISNRNERIAEYLDSLSFETNPFLKR